jgi:hypothetical protein
MMSLERVATKDVDWDALDRFSDRLFSHRRAWMEFVAETSNGEIIIARLLDGNTPVGWFSGIRFRKLGVPILGAPFPGWSTPYMGFNLEPDVPRKQALAALPRFAFSGLGCLHLEVMDRFAGIDDAAGTFPLTEEFSGYVSDLTPSVDELLQRMRKMTRRGIARAARDGVVVEVARPEGYAEIYYELLLEVFGRQGLKPTYPIDRVHGIIRHLHPTGDLLLLQARAPAGAIIAASFYSSFGRHAYFHGGASRRSEVHLHPNEALHWRAMQYMKERGVQEFEWGGKGDYKANYGAVPHRAFRMFKARIPGVLAARVKSRALWLQYRSLVTRLKGSRSQARSAASGTNAAAR